MKRLLFVLCLLSTSCSVTTEVAPVTPSSSTNVPGTVTGEQCRSVFQFLYALPVFLLSNYPDGPIGVSMKKLAVAHGGNALVNVTWSHTFTSYEHPLMVRVPSGVCEHCRCGDFYRLLWGEGVTCCASCANDGKEGTSV